MAYTFSHITAQPRAQLALLLALVEGGGSSVLLSSAKGMGKSMMLESLRSLAPERSILRIPSSTTQEMLDDRADLSRLLSQGVWVEQAGLLQRMSGSIVLMDNVNLLPSSVVRSILSHAEGLGEGERCIIIAATTPEEGALPSGVLDLFDLFVELEPITSVPLRCRVMRDALRTGEEVSEQATIDLVRDAAVRYPEVLVSGEIYMQAAELCREAYVLGHRADLALVRTAKAYAAWQGKRAADRSDLMAVRDLVLSHRLLHATQPEEAEQPESPPSAPQTEHSPNSEADSPSEQHDEPREAEPLDRPEDLPSSPQLEAGASERQSDIAHLGLSYDPVDMLQRGLSREQGMGRRIKSIASSSRGRFRRAEIPRTAELDLSVMATLRAAAPYQYGRRAEGERRVIVEPSDYRNKHRTRRSGYHILFLVDASGSMGVRRRMSQVKATILELLQEAYVQRDHVALMSFRGDEAKLILPFTRSMSRAYNLLAEIKTGGRTPLYLGLSRAYELLLSEQRKHRDLSPVVVLLSDGRATSEHLAENTHTAILEMARKVSGRAIRSIVIDTEEGFIRLGRARDIAREIGAHYYTLDSLIVEHPTSPFQHPKGSRQRSR